MISSVQELEAKAYESSDFLIAASAKNPSSFQYLMNRLTEPFSDRTLEEIGGRTEMQDVVHILASAEPKSIIEVYKKTPKYDRYKDYYGTYRGLWVGLIPYLYDYGLIDHVGCPVEFDYVINFLKQKDQHTFYSRSVLNEAVETNNFSVLYEVRTRKKFFSDDEFFDLNKPSDVQLVQKFRFRGSEIKVKVKDEIKDVNDINFVNAMFFDRLSGEQKQDFLTIFERILENKFERRKYILPLLKLLYPTWNPIY
jgi:hypothetical protein